MITIADLKQHLEQFDDDAMIVFRADTERELYDDVDYWEPDRVLRLNTLVATGEVEIECEGVD